MFRESTQVQQNVNNQQIKVKNGILVFIKQVISKLF